MHTRRHTAQVQRAAADLLGEAERDDEHARPLEELARRKARRLRRRHHRAARADPLR